MKTSIKEEPAKTGKNLLFFPKHLGFFSLVMVLLILALGCRTLDFSISFTSVNGLKKGDPVILGKNSIGKATKITYTRDARFLVQVKILDDFSQAATQDARFFIDTSPLDRTGQTMALLVEPGRGKKISPGSTVNGDEPLYSSAKALESLWSQVIRKAYDLMEEIEHLPEEEQYQALKEKLLELEDRLKTSSSRMKEFIKKDILPPMEEELNNLSEKLKKMGEKEKARSLEESMNRLQKI